MSHRYKPSVLDLAKPDFDVDAYLARLLKEKSLDELVKEEEEMVASVRRLDSDVHQIVYENYNKFLTATNTVRKIQDEFTQLDEEISALGTSMTNISGLIEGLGDVLGAKREDILQLGSSYKVVKSLKHIFDLPFVLTASFDEKNFGEVIRMYQLASESLRSFADVDSVKRVMEKSHKVYKATEEALMEQLKNPDSSVEAITNSVDLLLAIGRDRDEVHKVLLECSEQSLRTDLRDLGDNHADVLDLVDKGCGSFIPNLTLIAATHERLFPDKVDESLAMVKKLFERELDSFHALVSRSFLSSNDAKDCSIVVRALDRYFRKISTCRHVVRGLDFSKPTIALINEVSVHEIDLSLLRIQEELKNVLQETRQSLVNDGKDLVGLAAKIEHAFVYQVKTALANLLLFTASDVTFSSLPPEDFQVAFAQNAHERLLVQAFHRLFQTADDCADGKGDLRFVGPRLLLVFAVALQHLSNKSAMYLLNLCREQFNLSSSSEQLTSATKVTADVKTRAQRLVRCYAQRNGQQIGEHLAKGCGGGFVQPSASPTTVRAAIRRAVEETLGCDDELVSLLGGESKAKDVKPSRRPGAPGIEAARDSLWCERIDFHQQIHFNRASIMTGIVKVVLKIFTEAIRLQTYSKFGIEQIQVDCYYLQRGLAPLVTDEVMVNSMVDQSLSSALKRCVDPVLVHPSRLAQVCDQLQPAQQQQHRTSSTTSSALGY